MRLVSGLYLGLCNLTSLIHSHLSLSFSSMSLLYNLLRSNSHQPGADSDDDLVNVTSPITTPSHTRPPSPTLKGAAARPVPKPLHLNKSRSRTDPLRALPTELSQRIFSRLGLSDLAKCSLVSKKWNRSQTINYGQPKTLHAIRQLTRIH